MLAAELERLMKTSGETLGEGSGFGPWKSGAPISAGSGSMVESADWLIKTLPVLGVAIPAGSRLILARNRIARVHDRKVALDATDVDNLRKLGDAQRTIAEFYIILRALQKRRFPLTPGLLFKLSQMLGGSEIEDLDSNSIARNTQFELYVMSQFVTGGATVTLGEPDLRLLFGSETVGVAAKRLTSTKQLKKRVSEAADQIEGRGDRGFIAMNLDRFVTSVAGPSELESLDQRGIEFNKSIEDLHALLPSFDERPAIMGVMNFGFSCHWDLSGSIPRYSGGFFRQILRFTQSQDEIDHANDYFNTLSSRIQNELEQL